MQEDDTECIEACLVISDTPRKLYVLTVAGMFIVSPELPDLRLDWREHLMPLKLYLASDTC